MAELKLGQAVIISDEPNEVSKGDLIQLQEAADAANEPGVRNAVMPLDGRIDCEIFHPTYGWIPFTADSSDVNETGKLIHSYLLALGPEAKAPPSEEELLAASRARMVKSRTDLCLALNKQTSMSVEDAVKASKGDWPFEAEPETLIYWAGLSFVGRLDKCLKLLQDELALSDEQVDQLFN